MPLRTPFKPHLEELEKRDSLSGTPQDLANIQAYYETLDTAGRMQLLFEGGLQEYFDTGLEMVSPGAVPSPELDQGSTDAFFAWVGTEMERLGAREAGTGAMRTPDGARTRHGEIFRRQWEIVSLLRGGVSGALRTDLERELSRLSEEASAVRMRGWTEVEGDRDFGIAERAVRPVRATALLSGTRMTVRYANLPPGSYAVVLSRVNPAAHVVGASGFETYGSVLIPTGGSGEVWMDTRGRLPAGFTDRDIELVLRDGVTDVNLSRRVRLQLRRDGTIPDFPREGVTLTAPSLAGGMEEMGALRTPTVELPHHLSTSTERRLRIITRDLPTAVRFTAVSSAAGMSLSVIASPESGEVSIVVPPTAAGVMFSFTVRAEDSVTGTSIPLSFVEASFYVTSPDSPVRTERVQSGSFPTLTWSEGVPMRWTEGIPSASEILASPRSVQESALQEIADRSQRLSVFLEREGRLPPGQRQLLQHQYWRLANTQELLRNALQGERANRPEIAGIGLGVADTQVPLLLRLGERVDKRKAALTELDQAMESPSRERQILAEREILGIEEEIRMLRSTFLPPTPGVATAVPSADILLRQAREAGERVFENPLLAPSARVRLDRLLHTLRAGALSGPDRAREVLMLEAELLGEAGMHARMLEKLQTDGNLAHPALVTVEDSAYETYARLDQERRDGVLTSSWRSWGGDGTATDGRIGYRSLLKQNAERGELLREIRAVLPEVEDTLRGLLGDREPVSDPSLSSDILTLPTLPAHRWLTGRPFSPAAAAAVSWISPGSGEWRAGRSYLLERGGTERQFVAHAIETLSSGSAGFVDLKYVSELGIVPVPRDFYRVIGGRYIVHQPGAPWDLVLSTSGTAVISLRRVIGATEQEVMPNMGMELHPGIITVRVPDPMEGWQPFPHTFPSASHRARPGETVNMLFSVENLGIAGGDITATIRVGRTGTTADRIIRTFVTRIDAFGRMALSVNVPVEEEGIVTLGLSGEGSTPPLYGRRVQRPYSEEQLTEAQIQERVYRHTIRVILESTGIGTPEERLAAYIASYPGAMAYIPREVRGAVQLALAPIPGEGVGGGEVVDETPSFWERMKEQVRLEGPQSTYDTVMNLFRPEPGRIGFSIDGRIVRIDTAAGHLVAAIYNHILSIRGNREALGLFCAQIESITGIGALRIHAIARAGYPDFGRVLLNAFSEFGFDVTRAPAHSRDMPFSVDYSGDHVRFSFNPPMNGRRPDHGLVQLVSTEPLIIGGGVVDVDPVVGHVGDMNPWRLTLKVPDADIPRTGPAYFKAVLWWEGGVSVLPAYSVLREHVRWGEIETTPPIPSGPGLSTLPAGPDRDKENVILDILGNVENFPLRDPPIHTWNWNIASPFHDGLAINAVDINLPGDDDHGSPVFPPMRGIVVRTGMDGTHTVILKHESLIHGEPFFWYSKYLHMENIGKRGPGGTITPLQIDEVLERTDQFGAVSDIGSPGQYHFHFEALRDLVDGYRGHSIDLRRLLLERLRIATIYAEDAGRDGSQAAYEDNVRLQVEWNDISQVFVSITGPDLRVESNPHLFLDRSDQAGTPGEVDVPTARSNQHWVAFHSDPSRRARVVQMNIGTTTSPAWRWVAASFPEPGRDVWNPRDRTWVTRTDALSW